MDKSDLRYRARTRLGILVLIVAAAVAALLMFTTGEQPRVEFENMVTVPATWNGS